MTSGLALLSFGLGFQQQLLFLGKVSGSANIGIRFSRRGNRPATKNICWRRANLLSPVLSVFRRLAD